jgi:DUF1009 family protein
MIRRLTILAGSGALVPEIIGAAQAAGDAVQVLPLVDRADLGLTDRFGVADLPRLIWRIKIFRTTHVAMVGGLKTTGAEREAFKRFAGDRGKASGDGALLKMAERLLSMTGAKVIGAESIAPGILAGSGPIAGPVLSLNVEAAAHRALLIAREFGARDEGQAVVVAGGEAVAVEDAAGTDALLARVACMRAERDCAVPLILAKALKPRQSRLSDRPAIGPATIVNAAAAGIAVIAIEAGGAVIVDRAGVIAAANAAGISVIGMVLDG